jgi:hypothetical protein
MRSASFGSTKSQISHHQTPHEHLQGFLDAHGQCSPRYTAAHLRFSDLIVICLAAARSVAAARWSPRPARPLSRLGVAVRSPARDLRPEHVSA